MATASLKHTIERLVAREDLSLEEAQEAVEAVINGADPHQCAAFLVLLRAKVETPREVAGMVLAMRKHMIPVPLDGPTIDIVGTGGDGANTLNFSTAASLVAASCGASVAKVRRRGRARVGRAQPSPLSCAQPGRALTARPRARRAAARPQHGNRSVSSKSGSADVLQALGVKLDLDASQVRACMEEASICFMFAPVFHPAMKAIVPVRKALGVRTVFNILGPLLNPAGASHLLIGVYAPHLVELVARALFELKVERAYVVHCGGLDELAPIAVADVADVTRDGVTFSKLDPFELGFAKCTVDDLKGGDADENAAVLRKLLNGDVPGPLEVGPSAARARPLRRRARTPARRSPPWLARRPTRGGPQDTVVLNAGTALFVYGKAASVREGCEMARASVKSGAPLRTLAKWAAVCGRFA